MNETWKVEKNKEGKKDCKIKLRKRGNGMKFIAKVRKVKKRLMVIRKKKNCKNENLEECG